MPKINQTRLAGMIGVTPTRIRQLQTEGVLDSGKELDERKSLVALVQHYREMKKPDDKSEKTAQEVRKLTLMNDATERSLVPLAEMETLLSTFQSADTAAWMQRLIHEAPAHLSKLGGNIGRIRKHLKSVWQQVYETREKAMATAVPERLPMPKK